MRGRTNISSNNRHIHGVAPLVTETTHSLGIVHLSEVGLAKYTQTLLGPGIVLSFQGDRSSDPNMPVYTGIVAAGYIHSPSQTQ
jgi:hypothetical protein